VNKAEGEGTIAGVREGFAGEDFEPVKEGRTFLGRIPDSFELCREPAEARLHWPTERPAVVPNAAVEYRSFAPR